MSLSTLADLVGAMLPVKALWIVFEAALKGSALLLAAWAVTRGLRGASAALRHLIWASALGGMLLLPLASLVLPPLHVAGLPELGRAAAGPAISEVLASRQPEPIRVIDIAENTAVVAVEAPGDVPIPVIEATAPQPVSVWRYVPLAWLTVAALVLLRLIVGTLRVSTWTRRARVVDEGEWLSLVQRMAARLHITRPVTLLRSDRACVPMTWGVVYPTVLLPIDADHWPRERRMIVLLHELAHVKRFDAFTQLIAQLAVALFWFNPLVWLAARQMRTEREHACDDCVLEGGARATDYAYDLLQIARSLGGSSAPAAAALAMARQSEFEGRLLAILDPKTNRNNVSRARLVFATVAVLVLALPLAALRSAPAPIEQSLPQETPSVVVDVPGPAAIVPIATTAEPTPAAAVVAPVPQAVEPAPPPREISSLTPAPIATTQPVWSNTIPRPTVTAVTIRQSAQLRQQGDATQPPPDRETLIAVSRQAAKMKSDYDKAELLITVAKHYIRDDELRTAYLDAVASIRSSYEQSRTLLPMMLRDDLPPHAVAQVVKIASQMTSDNEKATLLVTTISEHDAMTLSTCDAIIGAAGTIRSDYDRGRTVAAIIKRGELSNSQLVDLIGIIKPMTGSYDKANALVNVSKRFSLADNDVRTAFFQAAETISSATDYRRVMQGVLK